MPLIADVGYQGLRVPGMGTAQTILPAFFRRVRHSPYSRQRIATPDGDFIDLDWSLIGGECLAILLHGLEGSSNSTYIRGMCRALNNSGMDVLAWNLRGCSGEINRALRFYHSGETDDMELVLNHILTNTSYPKIALIGFSAGGNITLKYLGEKGRSLSSRIAAAVAFSVPCDLRASSIELARPHKVIYTKWFLKDLQRKVRLKMPYWPEHLSDVGISKMSSFKEFDDSYTAPLHGFKNAEDYWARASSKPWLGRIEIPTLLVNASDDPFLPEECYPIQEANASEHLRLEIPKTGGHVGFISLNKESLFWSERRALTFLNEQFSIRSS